MDEREDPSGDGSEPTGAAAIVSALRLAFGRADKPSAIDASAGAFLDEQTRLVRLQIENLEEDRVLQHRHLALRFFGDRLRIGLQLLAIFVGLIVVGALGAMIWRAHEDHGLVIEAFSVPPAMAQDGLSGEVVATRFLDKLQALQSDTRSERPAASYENNWGADIKVEIPQTGITFGEFQALLRDTFGHASHVTGEVTRTAAGIALTARLGGQPPKTFTGAEADLDALAQQAAEDVYRTSQPYRYAEYLQQHGRATEAAAVASDLAANGPQSEHAWADSLLAELDLQRGDLGAARSDTAAGVAAGGDGVMWVNIARATTELWSGHDEALLTVSRDIDQNDAWRRMTQVTEAAFKENKLISSAYLAGQVGDFARAAADYGVLASTDHTLGQTQLYQALVADADAQDGDVGAAAAALPQARPADEVAFYEAEADNGYYALPIYQLAAAAGNWPLALANVRAVEALVEARKAAHASLGLMAPVLLHPLEALALVRTGDVAGAQALIATTPLDCYLCVRVRGEIAATQMDWPTSDRWFAEATRQAPSIPFAFAEWGDARLARGDAAGAATLFKLAHDKSPRYAAALKGWGDALTAQGDWGDALAKYDQALADAPAWRALRRARDAAARHAT